MIDQLIMGGVAVYVSLIAFGRIPDPGRNKRLSTDPLFKVIGPGLVAIAVALAIAHQAFGIN
ncbi:MAG: hypothetical protein JWO36_5831 [Myxococcales bacterium]|nr:hypothetical protein [Myxococcales bacterium]